MIESTKAIVLNAIKFQDSSLIVKCYTQKGIKSYLLKGILKSKKGKLKPAYFQVFTLLDLVVNHNNKGSLNYIKEAFVYHPFHAIPTDIYKSSIALFLSEILANVLKEEEENLPLYQYLETAFIWLDTHPNTSNFHLLFLINLSKYLGFYPNKPKENDSFFNLQDGTFSFHKPLTHHISGENFTLFKSIIGINFDAISQMPFNAKNRQDLLKILIQYFALHLPGFKNPKSLAVLQTIFA
ncbi:MAG: DNA repair protein RecO [Flavobacteriaceae bacterium]